MRHSAHPSETDLLLAMDDELSVARRSAVDAHVAACPSCRARTTQLRGALDAFGRVHHGTAPEASVLDDAARDAAARRRLTLALREASAAGSRAWPAPVREVVAAAPRVAATVGAVAAALLLVVWAGVPAGGPFGAPAAVALASPLPVAALTPGAVAPLTAEQLCAGERPSRLVAEDVRERVLADYGMQAAPDQTYELDALITPELGGTTARENLWPQPYQSPVWNAHVKDALEQHFAQLVCRNSLALADAQRELASDWVAAYQRHFATAVPLRAHLDASEDDNELLFALATPGPRDSWR